MSNKYELPEIDTAKIKRYSIKKRKSKVHISSFSDIKKWEDTGRMPDLFPDILKAKELIEIADSVLAAYKDSKPVIFAMGAHVIKCGLSPIIIDLIKRGILSGIAMNGAGAVHDYEIAFHGSTSEDVSEQIKEGRFGMSEETGSMINKALRDNVNADTGMGEAIGMDISKNDLAHKDLSIIYACFKEKVPVTVHVAVGTDITHLHPSADGAVIGTAAYNDFRLFSSMIAAIGNGGCFFNIGSSVILPEVFLKALTLTRNIGYDVNNFITVNMDMIQHYRPNVNVVTRPNKNSGKGYSITGHHEIMIPLLYTMIREKLREVSNT